jgi:pantoate kinase
MKTAAAYSPGHITGLFYIADTPPDPLLRGSCGAGLSVSRGVRTRVSLDPGRPPALEVHINGRRVEQAPVSVRVAELFSAAGGSDRAGRLRVEHGIEVPEGAGFGSSGAGALSLALALNDLYGSGLSRIEAARLAHVAEVECRTGLGTVMGELVGGMKILVEPGAPGIGRTVAIPHPPGLKVLFLVFGPYSTAAALRDPGLRAKIDEAGRACHSELLARPSTELFMDCSRRFAEQIGLIPQRLRPVLTALDRAGLPGSMLMFGEVVFSVVKEERVPEVLELFDDFRENAYTLVCDIETRGAEVNG